MRSTSCLRRPASCERPQPLSDRPHAERAGRYTLLAFATLVIALVGYLGYVLYPRFDLPAARGATLLVLAAGAGIASFFSPCSFPLLLSLLARPIAAEGAVAHSHPFRQAATFAAALSLGAASFLVLAGLAIAAGAATFFDDVTFTSTAGIAIRIFVGVFLIALGLVQLGVLPISFRRFEPAMHGYLRQQAELRRRRPFVGFTMFGFGYLLAGFG
jgi:cytochrome c biogenesis protein CcdA